jgi:hypothetical protein
VLLHWLRVTPAKAFSTYRGRVEDAVERQLHHDQRRAYLTELLREGFGIDVEEVELEHNVRLAEARGRIDLLYRNVVFEVKRDLTKERDDVERELELYLSQVAGRSFGLATDGRRFEAYRLSGGQLEKFDELDVFAVDDEEAVAWLDAYLFSQSEVVPTAEDVVRRFGPRSAVFLAGRDELEELWATVADQPAVAIKREEWDRLLRMVYGSPKGSDELFVRHTYLALVARLFAYLAIARRLPERGEELQIIRGEAFEKLGIENLVEEDFFAWIADETVLARAAKLASGLARHLGVYATDRIDEDLLKHLYETLVDPVDRHDLGEYYTPDWLADLVLQEAGYTPGQRLLDPACGSGTFLFTAVRRLRAHGLTGTELVEEAQANIMGFDVHPLAVTVARANFVLALREDAVAAKRTLTVPVWMADSLAVPEQTFGKPIEVVVPPNAKGVRERFVLPTEMEDARTGTLQEAASLVADFSRADVSDRDAEEGLRAALGRSGVAEFADQWVENLELFRKLVKDQRNTVWSFVLSNAVRPQMVARAPVDLVVGNPPWLPLRDISEVAYQERVTQLALDYRVLPSRRGWRTGALELATVFACFSLDHFVRPGGRLAFVLPRGVLWGAKQHESFRNGAVSVPMTPVLGLDLEQVSPLFRVPSCVAIVDRERTGELNWEVRDVAGVLPRRNASPSEACVLNIGEPHGLESETTGPSHYLDRAIQGATIAPRPFWFVEPTSQTDAKRPWVVTDKEASGRAKAPWTGLRLEGQLESDYLFATSLAVFPFKLGPIKLIFLPVEIVDGKLSLLGADQALRRGAPGAHRWLVKGEKIWSERKKDSASQKVPLFKYLDNHRNLTRQRLGGTHLVYGADGSHVRAVVVDTDELAKEHGVRGFVFDMNLYAIRAKTPDEAHYLAAILNTPYVDEAIKSRQTRGAWGARHIHRRPFEAIAIPEFNPFDERHVRLAQLSIEAHAALADRPISRIWKDQLEPALAQVEQADSLARQVCAAGQAERVLA